MSLDEIINCDHQFSEIDGYYTCIKCGYCNEKQILVQQIFIDDEKHKEQFKPLVINSKGATTLNPFEHGVSNYYKETLIRAKRYKQKNNNNNTKESFLNNSISKIKDYFTKTVTDSARRMFNDIYKEKFIKGRSYETVLATCFYIASNNEKQPKLLFEIEKIFKNMDLEIKSTAINSTISAIKKRFKDQIKILHKPSLIDYTPNYCEQIDLPIRITNQVTGLITYLLDHKNQDKIHYIIKNYKKIKELDISNLELELENKKELSFIKTITSKELMIEKLKTLSKDIKKTLLINPSIIGRSESGTIGGAIYYCLEKNQLTQEELEKMRIKLNIKTNNKISQVAIANYLKISEIVIRNNYKIIELYKTL